MNKTKIEWCDSTWNPVTGCRHGCEYCYARRIAERFGGASETHHNEAVWNECQWVTEATGKPHVLNTPIYDYDREHNAPYPYYFDPTFHRYRLGEYEKKTGRTIFVCSTADLFGDWVPDEWIDEVFAACKEAPQHRYMFLTKNPERYARLAQAGKLPTLRECPNFWYGTSVTKAGDKAFTPGVRFNTFLSIEPLLEPLDVGLGSFGGAEWIIIGAETGNRKDKVVPRREWVQNICEAADLTHAAVFMKDSLLPIMGEENMRRELPWKQVTLAPATEGDHMNGNIRR